MLLKKGSSGEDVKKLQEKLGLSADGVFGPGTEAKVKEWQAANGLTADGIVGQATWGRLFPTSDIAPTPSAPVQAVPSAPVAGVNLAKLKGHVPDTVIAQLPEVMTKFGIDTGLKIAHFLSQCGHESGGFRVVTENLNYSKDGLRKIFGRYFPTDELAAQYARQPEKIANRVYANRMRNGNEASGDGWRFRGRGYIQLTGRENYTSFSGAVNPDILTNPDLVATQYPLLSAAWFFTRCLPKCKDATFECVKAVTRCVNGGEIGLNDRWEHFQEYYALLK